MSPDDIKFYRDLYKLLSNEDINALFVKYANMKYNEALKMIRSRTDEYDHGLYNGRADAYSDLVNLKTKVMAILNNVG